MRARQMNGNVKITQYASVDALEQSAGLHNGYLTVRYNDLPVDFYYRGHPDADTLIVMLHGAVEKELRWPWFNGMGVLKDLPTNKLFIADPTIGLDEGLRLAWYAGSAAQPELQSVIGRAVEAIHRLSGSANLAFFGSSGGGFAALQFSRHFPESLAIAVNPQTSISRYFRSSVQDYERRAWDLGPVDSLPIEHDLTSAYNAGHSNTIAYIQNERDKFHIREHQSPFLHSLPDNSRVWRFESRWGDNPSVGHVAPPREVIRTILERTVTAQGLWGLTLDRAGFAPGDSPVSYLADEYSPQMCGVTIKGEMGDVLTCNLPTRHGGSHQFSSSIEPII